MNTYIRRISGYLALVVLSVLSGIVSFAFTNTPGTVMYGIQEYMMQTFYQRPISSYIQQLSLLLMILAALSVYKKRDTLFCRPLYWYYAVCLNITLGKFILTYQNVPATMVFGILFSAIFIQANYYFMKESKISGTLLLLPLGVVIFSQILFAYAWFQVTH